MKLRKINNICNKCKKLFKSADNGQMATCPDCNSRDTRQTTAIEDHQQFIKEHFVVCSI